MLRALAFGHPPRGSRSHVERVLSHAADLARDGSLLPPAEAAFLEKPRVDVQSSHDLGSPTHRLLEAQLGDPARARNETPGDVDPYIAYRYAEALLRQEEVLEALSRVDELNAPVQAALPRADRERVDDFLLYRNVGGRFETLDSLLNRWARAVASLEERPELWTEDVYVDWLHTRDSLENALSVPSPATRQGVEPAVRPHDDALLRLTRPNAQSVSPLSPWGLQSWWWFRLPGDSRRA